MDDICGPFEVKVDRRLEARLARQSVEKKGSVVHLRPKQQDEKTSTPSEPSSPSNVIKFPKRVSEDSKTLIHRNFDCPNYEGCLSLSATMNWDSFTCENCPGLMNRNLIIRAEQKRRTGTDASPLYRLPSGVGSKPSRRRLFSK